MLLETPFELVNGPSKSYIVSPFSVHCIDRIQQDLSEFDLGLLSTAYRDLTSAIIDVNIIIVDPPSGVIESIDGFTSVYHENYEWPEGRGTRKIIDVIIFAEGLPRHLNNRDPRRPAIVYCYDELYRYRSCINWLHSGRPCPICSLKIFQSEDSESVRLINRVLSFSRRNRSGSSSQIQSLRQLNIIKTVCDAVTIATALKTRDADTMNNVRYAERLDMTNNNLVLQVFPTDPQCDHEDFYGR